jgi:hypothetical protein
VPFQNLTKFSHQKQGTKLNLTMSGSEEHLDLESKIDAITRYQKPYNKKILTMMACANPKKKSSPDYVKNKRGIGRLSRFSDDKWVISHNGYTRGQCWNMLNHAWIGYKRALFFIPPILILYFTYD